MKNNFGKTLLSIFTFAFILLGSSASFAKCEANAKPIQSGTSENQKWESISNNYAPVTRQAIIFNDFTGGIAKLPQEHKHPAHYYKHDLLVVIIDGEIQVTSNDKTTTYKKGEYFIVPANTCFSSYSKTGATIVMVGAKPGDSFPAQE